MADIVESVLQAAAEREAKYKPIEVHKDVELEIDEGNLLAIDHNPLELNQFRSVCVAYSNISPIIAHCMWLTSRYQ